MKKTQPPIVIKEGTTTITDNGIFRTREWAPATFDELKQVLAGAGGHLEGKRRRLQNIISGSSNTEQPTRIEFVVPLKGISTGRAHPSIKIDGFPGQNAYSNESRVAAERALSLLDKFLAGSPTDDEKKAFLGGCKVEGLMLIAEILPCEQDTLKGKRTRARAAGATAGKKTAAQKRYRQIREWVQKELAENKKMSKRNACKRAAEKFEVSVGTVYKALKV
jgi:hypothetical protein